MIGLRLKKQENYYVLPIKLLLSGIRKVKYVLLELHPTTEDIILRTYRTLLAAMFLLLLKRKGTRCVTLEYLPPSKWMTLNDKRITSNQDSLITSWLQMSVLGLTGKDKGLKPFWNKQCLEISQKLWLPTEIDSVGSPTNFWSGSSNVMESNSWFSMRRKENLKIKSLQTTFSPSYMFIPTGMWEDKDIRTRKIRIYPTPQQKQKMKSWMATRRYVYNKSLEKIKKKESKLNFYQLRNDLVTAKNNDKIQDWELKTPKDIRAGAIRDMIKNYKAAFSNLRNRNISGFKMGFARKREAPSIEIPKSAIKLDNGLFIYTRYMPKKIKIAKHEKINFTIDYDCRLQVKNNKWFLVVPINVKATTYSGRSEFCSLDPGVRTFQTVYSEESVLQIKINKQLVKKLQKKIDHFRSLRARKIITTKRLKRRERKIYFRINNLIDELHHKTIRFLTTTYNHIILPSFESQEISKRRKIRGINRDLLQLKHFLFKERLKAKCLLTKCTLDICTEEYTSQTCGVCGKLTPVKGKDVFTCSKCNINIDRDVNGTRNIAIKRLKEVL